MQHPPALAGAPGVQQHDYREGTARTGGMQEDASGSCRGPGSCKVYSSD